MSKRGANFSTTGVAKNIKKVQMDHIDTSIRADVATRAKSMMSDDDMRSINKATDLIFTRSSKYEDGSLNKHQIKEFESAQKVYRDLIMKYSKAKK